MKRWRTEAVNVKDKVVIITGGGGGIGLAAARAFAHGQAHVLITGRRGQALEEIASREQRIKAFVADVGNPADAPRTIAKAVELWGRIDVFVNNAGAGVQWRWPMRRRNTCRLFTP